MDCARDEIGGIEGMLHNENGAINGATEGNHAPLVDDTSELIKRPP